MSAEVASVARSWYPRDPTVRGDTPDAQTAARRLVSVIAIDYLTFSALATIIATERSDDGFTPFVRSQGAGLPTARLSVSAVMPGRRMRARTVVSGTVIVRQSLKRANFEVFHGVVKVPPRGCYTL